MKDQGKGLYGIETVKDKRGVVITRKNGVTTKIKATDAMVKIPRGTAHAVVNRGKSELVVFCFYTPKNGRKLTRIRDEVVA